MSKFYVGLETTSTLTVGSTGTFTGDITAVGESRKIRILNAGAAEAVQLLSDGSGDGQLRINNSAGTTVAFLYGESGAHNYINRPLSINTTTAQSGFELTVSGDGYASGNWEAGGYVAAPTLYTNEYIYHSGNTDCQIRFRSNRLTLYADSGTAGYIDLHDNGNIYLSPSNSTALTLDGSQDATFAGKVILANNKEIEQKDAAGTAARIMYLDNADTLCIGNPTTVDDIRFDVDTYGESAMIILSSGNVGIGETAPEVKLEVAGDILAKDAYISCGLGATDGYQFHDFGSGYGLRGVTGGVGSRISIYTDGSERFYIDANGDATFLKDVTINNGDAYNQLLITDATGTSSNKQSGIMTVNYAGNNTSIFQTYCTSTANTIYYGSADGNYRGITDHRFYVNAAVDATTSHTLALHIDGDTSATFAGTLASSDITVTSSGGSTYLANFLPSTGSAYAKFYQDSNNHMSLYMAATGGTANVVLNSSGVSYVKGGNFIIGGSSDSGELLQVEGTAAFAGNITFSSGSDIIFPDNLGAALEFKEGSNLYMRFVTTNGSEEIQMEKATTISNTLNVSGNITGVTETLTGATSLMLTLNPTANSYGGIWFKYGGVSKGMSVYNSGSMIYGGESGVGTKLQADGQTGLTIDTSQNSTFAGTLTTSGNISSGGHVYVTDGNKFIAGSGEDFQIWHAAGENTYLRETGEGATVFQSNGWYFQNTASPAVTGVHFTDAGAATFSGSVTGTSATFNGGITVDGIYIDGTEIDLSSGTLTFDADAYSFLDGNATFASAVTVGGKIHGVTAGTAGTDAINLTQLNAATTGVLVYQGTWNASTNSPTLASGTGTPGYYYIVATAGSTNLDGITDWKVGDWAIFTDHTTDHWQKIDNTSVLDGDGTAGSLTAWLTSSELTEAPITYSGNDVTFTGSLAIPRYLQHDGDTNTYLDFQPDRITLRAGNIEFVDCVESTQDVLTLGGATDIDVNMRGGDGYIFIQGSNGYIGINDITPSYPLDINANTYITGTLETTGTATFAGNIILDDGSGNSPYVQFINSDNDEWYIQNNSSSKLRFVQNGTERGLWSSGELELTNGLIVGDDATFNGFITVAAYKRITVNVPSAGGTWFTVSHSGNESWTWEAQSGTGNDDYLSVGIGGGTRAMSWHEDGKIGIGTTTPDAKLSVTSTSTNSEDILYLKSGADNADEYLGLAFEIGGGGNGPHGAIRVYNGPSGNDAYMSLLTTTDGGTLTQGLTQDHVGNIGVGVVAPSSRFEVLSNTDYKYVRFRADNNEERFKFYVGASGNSSSLTMYDEAEAAKLKLSTGGDSYFTGGNVGIGTASPDANLHVFKASAGTVTAASDAQLIVENSGVTAINLLSPNTSHGQIIFGDPDDNDVGQFGYDHDTNSMYIKTNGSGTKVFLVDSAGRVGLNGTTPSDFNADADDLIVGSGSGDTGITIHSGSNVGNYGAIYFADGTTGSAEYRGIISYEQNTEKMRFHTNTTEALSLDSSQNATFAGDVSLGDDKKLKFGAAPDFEIYHNSTTNLSHVSSLLDRQMSINANIIQLTNQANSTTYLKLESTEATFTTDVRLPASGKLYTWTGSNDNYLTYNSWYIWTSLDIILRNSGTGPWKFQTNGANDVLTLDSSQNATFAGAVNIAASQKIYLGGSTSRMQVYHTGSSGEAIVLNKEGNLSLVNQSHGDDIIFKTEDVSGNVVTPLSLDSAGDATFAGNIKLEDDKQLNIGTGNDLQLYHDASNSLITNAVGHLYIINSANDKNIYFQTDDGSGGFTTYMKCDGLQNFTEFPVAARFMDNVKLQFGNSNDSDIYHNGTDMIIRNHVAAGDMNFSADSTGSGGSATSYFWLDGGVVKTRVAKGMNFEDNVKLTFGNVSSPDLEIYHDTSNSYISDIGTGDLIIKGAVVIQDANGDQGAEMHHNALHLQFEGSDVVSPASATTVDIHANLRLNSGTSKGNIELDVTPGSGNTSGTLIKIGTGTTVYGTVYYLDENGAWLETNANAIASSYGLIAVANGTSPTTNGMLTEGIYYDSAHGFDIGVPLYLNPSTSGTIDDAPVGSNDIARVVGYAIDANNIYFQPDKTWISVD